MQNKLILHIGMPKTGTTTIQKFLYYNKKNLKNKNWLYVNPQYIDVSNPTYYLNKIYNMLDLSKNSVIFSSEGLWLVNICEFLDNIINNKTNNVKVIVYLRRQDRWIESWWNQMIKCSNLSLSIKEFIEVQKGNFDYLSKLNEISNIIGKDNLIISIFEKEQMINSDLITDFVQILKLPINCEKNIKIYNENISISLNQLQVKNVINSCFKEKDFRYFIFDFIHKNLYSKHYNLTSETVKHSLGLLTEEERKSLLDKYTNDNSIVAREYLGREDGLLFYDNKPIKCDSIDVNQIYLETKNIFYLLSKAWKNRLSKSNIIKNSYLLEGEFIIYLQNEYKLLLKEYENFVNEFSKKLDNKISNKNKCLEIVKSYINEFIKFEKHFRLIEKNILNNEIKNRKVIIMPAGIITRYILQNTYMKFSYILDNNKSLAGKKINDIEIRHPSQIKDIKDYFILVATNTDEIMLQIEKQLQNYGLEKHKDYEIDRSFYCLHDN